MGKEWETKNVNRKTDGYFTVEATLIMPVVLYVCIFIIYTGFYLYDKCVMKQDAYRAALTGSSIYRDDNQKVYNAASDRVVKLAADKYIATDYSYIITVQNKVKVTIEGRLSQPFHGLASLIGKKKWVISESAESKCINPVVFIRIYHKLEEEFSHVAD